MVYKIVNEWFSEDRKAHEITIYKYNYSFDLVMRYNYEQGDECVTFISQDFGGRDGVLEGEFKIGEGN